MLGNDADEIIPGLWLGNYKPALDLDFIKNNNINVIINCTADIPFYNEMFDTKLKIETFRISVYDSLLEKDILLMEEYFKHILPYMLKKYIHEKKRILVHCKAGAQRSAIVVAAFLKILLDKNLVQIPDIPSYPRFNQNEQFKHIYNFLLKRRPRVFTYGFRINFERSYKRFFHIY
jgi:protein tyrosine/serine phosphatase